MEINVARKITFSSIYLMMILSLILSSCTGDDTVSLPTAATNTSSTASPTDVNRWDKFGKPQYGGTIIYRSIVLSPSWDTATWVGA